MKRQRRCNYHFLQISGALRNVPSPLQGTSHKTRSNWSWRKAGSLMFPFWESPEWFLCKWQLGKCCASWFVTTKLAVHILFVWWIRRLHLWTSRSFAITYIIGIIEYTFKIRIQNHITANSVFHLICRSYKLREKKKK